MAEAPPLGAVVVVVVKMQSLTRQHRQPATTARLAVRLSQQRLTQLLMLRSVPGGSGVYPAAPAPRHNTPPTVSRRYSPATPTQLRPGLMRHLHNLPARRLTNQTVNALTATLTLTFERFPAQCAISLHNHRTSLSIVAWGPPLGERTFGGRVPKMRHQEKTDLLCNAFLPNHQRRELSNAATIGKTCVRR